MHRLEQISTTIAQTSAAVAVAPGVASFFSMEWWNANSDGIVALCAVAGAIISLTSFLIGQYLRHKRRKRDKK